MINKFYTLLSVMEALTGLTLEDIAEETTASTPEELARVQGRNVRKMAAHARGVPLEAVPNFMEYPETGFPPHE